MYKSPIEMVYGQLQTQIDGDVCRAVQSYNIIVDKDELIKALRYDRGQYDKGYQDAMDTIVRCKDCQYWDTGRCEAPENGLVREYTQDNDYCSYGERKGDA